MLPGPVKQGPAAEGACISRAPTNFSRLGMRVNQLW